MDLLSHPLAYGFLQQIVGRPGSRDLFTQRYLCPVPGERLLDLGCGLGDLVDYLPPLDYWGLDSCQRYIDFAKKKFGARAKFINADLCQSPWPVQGLFDRAAASGVLHHLSDDQGIAVLRNTRRVLKPGAKLITLDGCYEDRQSPIARTLLSMDRGKFVRDEKGYLALARSAFNKVSARMERGFLRVPYSHLIMEMTAD